jgi:predicted dehydrogenase
MSEGITRRNFLAGASIAFPAIISSGCIGMRRGMVAPKRPQPSERINVGIIGYGTMAYDNIGNFLENNQVQVTAVSDPVRGTDKLYGYRAERGGGMEPCKKRVDEFYAKKAGAPAYNGCKMFFDFRELIEKAGVDAVLISTPDHWHAIQAIYAARNGKHVYCQKPMTLTIGQGKAMVRAVKEAGVTFQVGAQSRSNVEVRRACEFVRNGYLGKIQRVEVGLPSGKFDPWGKEGKWVSKEEWPSPPDYYMPGGFEMWQGPTAYRKFIPAIHCPMSWRFNLAYSGGFLTDHGAHQLDILQWALGKDETGPVAVENIKGDIDLSDPVLNTAGQYSFEVVYADGIRVYVSSSLPYGVHVFGEDNKQITTSIGRLITNPPELYRTKLKDTDTHLYVSGQQEKNFIDCIFNGQKTISPVEVGHHSITLAHIANIGMRLGIANLKWDPVEERFTNSDEANKLIDRPLLNGWKLDPWA